MRDAPFDRTIMFVAVEWFVETNAPVSWAAYRRDVPRRAKPYPAGLTIGQRIRSLREEAGLGLEEFAHHADYSKGHLSNLERGYVMPTVATLRLLADALGVLVADLVSDPEGSDRERILDLTRRAPAGTLKRLAKDLAKLKPEKRRS